MLPPIPADTPEITPFKLRTQTVVCPPPISITAWQELSDIGTSAPRSAKIGDSTKLTLYKRALKSAFSNLEITALSQPH